MDMKSFLIEKRTAVLERWLDYVLSTYPQQTAEFLKNRKNQFANPAGHMISEGMGVIFDELLMDLEPGGKSDAGVIAEFLDNIIRIRAIQDFSASQALGFIFSLKKAVREEAGAHGVDGERFYMEFGGFESAVDNLALAAFDIYVQCREKIFELKADEVRNQTFRLLQQANIITGAGEAGGYGGVSEENPVKPEDKSSRKRGATG